MWCWRSWSEELQVIIGLMPAWQHQAITWTNDDDLLSIEFLGTNPSEIQVLELMQMHPKERLGRGYFYSQLV